MEWTRKLRIKIFSMRIFEIKSVDKAGTEAEIYFMTFQLLTDMKA